MKISYRIVVKLGPDGTIISGSVTAANKVQVERRDAAGISSTEEYTEAGQERIEIRCYTDRQKDGPEVTLTIEPVEQ